MRKKITPTLSFILLCFSGIVRASEYDVYLVCGQSNMDGRAPNSDLTGRLAGWAGTQTNVLAHYVNPINTDPDNPSYQTGWTNLMPGFSVAPGYSGTLPSSTYGPGVSFGKMMADSFPNRNLALIKVTKGGTNLYSDWSPSSNGFMWDTFTNYFETATQELNDAGHTVNVRGMIWHQGESDINRSSVEFTADLTNFLAAVRTLVGISDLPIVLGELSSSYNARTVDMNVVATLDSYTTIASSDDLETADGTHFNAVSQLALGRRFAAAIQAPSTTSELVNNDRVVFFGDSITAKATGAAGYITLFSEAVAEAYPTKGIQVVGAGVSGNKIPDLMVRLDADVLSYNPSIVVIYIGINDVWHWTRPDPSTGLPRKGTTAEAYYAGLTNLIQRVEAVGARAVLCSPTVIGEQVNPDDENYGMLEEFAAICRTVAQETGSQLVDLRSIFTDYLLLNNTADAHSGILTADTVHMNATGNQLIAKNMETAFRIPDMTGLSITQIGDNGMGESWETGPDWSNGNSASAGNEYINQTNAMISRTPVTSNPAFPGASLTLANGAILRLKHSGTATISNLVIDADSQLDNGSASCTVDGNIALTGLGTINLDAQASSRITTIDSLVTAAATIDTINIRMSGSPWSAPGNTAGFVMNHSGNVFAGTWNVETGMLKGAGFGSASFHVGNLGYLDFDADFLNLGGALTVENSGVGGKILLDQNLLFGKVILWGDSLSAGTYTGVELKTNAIYGAAFDTASSDSATLTVQDRVVVTQTGSNGIGESWETGADWSDGSAASAGKEYINQTSSRISRTPNAASPVFPGASLTLANGAILRLKHSGTATIANFMIDAGSQLDNGGASCGMYGSIALTGSGAINFDSQTSSRITTIDSLVTAAATLETINIKMTQVPWSSPAKTGGFVMNHPDNVFTGTWNVETGMLKGAGFGSASFNVGSLGYLDFDADFTNTEGALSIENSGKVLLDQNVTFSEATIWGETLAPGIYTGAVLKANATYGAAFDSASSDSATLTVVSELAEIGAVSIGCFGTEAVLGWNGSSAGTYNLQFKTNLLEGVWSNLVEEIAGVNGTMSITTNLPYASTVFYRVIGN